MCHHTITNVTADLDMHAAAPTDMLSVAPAGPWFNATPQLTASAGVSTGPALVHKMAN